MSDDRPTPEELARMNIGDQMKWQRRAHREPQAEASVSDGRYKGPPIVGWANLQDAPVAPTEYHGQWVASGQRGGKLAKQATDFALNMIERQNTAIEEGIAAFVSAGVPIERLEVVHETYSKNDEFTTIHSRAYVRVREGS
ncbi:MAG: hypothetical protein ACPGVG_18955 [Mycobacterium sp.]